MLDLTHETYSSFYFISNYSIYSNYKVGRNIYFDFENENMKPISKNKYRPDQQKIVEEISNL